MNLVILEKGYIGIKDYFITGRANVISCADGLR